MPRRNTGRPPGRPVTDPARDARELLLRAAVELFAEHGIAATTFSTIAKRAGMTPAMMHYYFKSRDQLLDAVVEERMAPLITRVWDPIEAGEPPAEMVRGFVRRLLEGIEANPWLPPTWIREVLNERGLLRTRMMRHIPREKVQIFCAAIAQAQRRRMVNPELQPLLLVFSMLGLVMLHSATLRILDQIFEGGPVRSKVLERHITGLLLHGLERRTESARTIKTNSRRSEDA